MVLLLLPRPLCLSLNLLVLLLYNLLFLLFLLLLLVGLSLSILLVKLIQPLQVPLPSLYERCIMLVGHHPLLSVHGSYLCVYLGQTLLVLPLQLLKLVLKLYDLLLVLCLQPCYGSILVISISFCFKNPHIVNELVILSINSLLLLNESLEVLKQGLEIHLLSLL